MEKPRGKNAGCYISEKIDYCPINEKRAAGRIMISQMPAKLFEKGLSHAILKTMCFMRYEVLELHGGNSYGSC